MKRYKPVPLKLTGHKGIDAERLREQREFEERMKSGAEWRKAQERPTKKEQKYKPVRYKKGRPLFTPGKGRLS